jgi:hypothetical protein
MKRFSVVLTAALVACFVLPASAQTVVRHVYNKSSTPLRFEIAPDVGGIRLSSTCTGQTTANNVTSCTLAPNTDFEIVYVYGHMGGVVGSVGWLTLQDTCGNRRSFQYNNTYIKHNGATTGVNLNDPTSGDITFFGC